MKNTTAYTKIHKLSKGTSEALAKERLVRLFKSSTTNTYQTTILKRPRILQIWEECNMVELNLELVFVLETSESTTFYLI